MIDAAIIIKPDDSVTRAVRLRCCLRFELLHSPRCGGSDGGRMVSARREGGATDKRNGKKSRQQEAL